MEQNEFKVLDWLRSMRDEHSQYVLNQPWETIHEETTQGANEAERRIEEIRRRRQFISAQQE